jgi:hypothetical protein
MTVNWTDRVVELRDADTFEVLVGPVAASDVSSVGGQSPDILAGNRYAVTGSLADGGATLWDVETLTPIGDPFPHVTDYRDPAVAADANLLGTTTEDGPVIWNIDVESWPDLACRLVGRNLTAAEWEEFGPQDQPYRPTCDRWPALG